jgi:hypothetical protein
MSRLGRRHQTSSAACHRDKPLSYTPPPNGFRTFTIVWLTQSLSVFGGAMMRRVD